MAVSADRNTPVHTHSAELDGASIGQLTARLSEQVSHLVRDELALAQVEAKQKAKRMGLGFGMFGASGALAFYGLGAAVAAAVLGVATQLTPWLAAIVVAGGLFLLAGMIALTGKRSVAKGSPPLPKEAIDSTKADVAAVRKAVKR
jgi:uncharacterized membrane protein YqjE